MVDSLFASIFNYSSLLLFSSVCLTFLFKRHALWRGLSSSRPGVLLRGWKTQLLLHLLSQTHQTISTVCHGRHPLKAAGVPHFWEDGLHIFQWDGWMRSMDPWDLQSTVCCCLICSGCYSVICFCPIKLLFRWRKCCYKRQQLTYHIF